MRSAQQGETVRTIAFLIFFDFLSQNVQQKFEVSFPYQNFTFVNKCYQFFFNTRCKRKETRAGTFVDRKFYKLLTQLN